MQYDLFKRRMILAVVMIILAIIFCLVACNNFGGDNTVKKQDTNDQAKVYQDSLAVKDTLIIDSIKKRKTGE